MTDLQTEANDLGEVLHDLATLTVEQIQKLLQQYDDHEIIRAAVPELVAPFTQGSATVTAQWYDELNPSSDFRATPVVDLPEPKVDSTVRWALYAPGEANPQDRLAGAAQRWVYDASRDTVTENAASEGVMWARHAQPDACAFCRLLATKEDAYRSKKSAINVVGRRGRTRGSRKLGQKYHDFCRCQAVPVRGDSVYTPPAYVAQWAQEYADASGGGLKATLANMRAANTTNKK